MKRLVFTVGVLALGFAASTPARADFSVVRFELGYCRIWWNNGINPIGTGWTRVATAPDFTSAWTAQDAAVKKEVQVTRISPSTSVHRFYDVAARRTAGSDDFAHTSAAGRSP